MHKIKILTLLILLNRDLREPGLLCKRAQGGSNLLSSWLCLGQPLLPTPSPLFTSRGWGRGQNADGVTVSATLFPFPSKHLFLPPQGIRKSMFSHSLSEALPGLSLALSQGK